MKLGYVNTAEIGEIGTTSCLRRALSGILLLSAALLLAGCDAKVSDDHGHEHGSQAEAHEHGEDAHTHDAAPATEAFYGEPAETQAPEAMAAPELEAEPSESQQGAGHTHSDGVEHQHEH